MTVVLPEIQCEQSKHMRQWHGDHTGAGRALNDGEPRIVVVLEHMLHSSLLGVVQRALSDDVRDIVRDGESLWPDKIGGGAEDVLIEWILGHGRATLQGLKDCLSSLLLCVGCPGWPLSADRRDRPTLQVDI